MVEEVVIEPPASVTGFAARDGRVKTWLALGFVFTLAWIPAGAWDALLGAALALWLAISWGGPGLIAIWRRSLVAFPFMLAALTLTIARPGTPLAQITIAGQEIAITDAGVVAAATVLGKAWLSVQAIAALIATTHFSELLLGLAALRVPNVLIMILGVAYRYLFVLQDEAIRMLRARDNRRAALPDRRAGRSIAWRAMITGRIAATLFLRAYERSERIYAAMLARGYNGHPTLAARPPLQRADYLLLIGGGVWFVILLIIAAT